jgi:uncharacterized protein YdaU (DUF1376 family)
MIYYRRYMGAYQKRTKRLSMRDHGAYSLMLDFYYAEEAPLPLEFDDILEICRARTADDRKSIEKVLRLHFEKRADGYHNERADEEIAASQQARTNGQNGGRKKKKTDDGTGGDTGDDTGGVTEEGTEPKTGPKTGSGTDTGTGLQTGKGGGLVHPSTFNHSAFQPSSLSTDQPPTVSAAENRAPNPAPPPPRAVAVAVLLRKLEQDRGKAPRITSIDPRLIAWTEAGVTDEQLREAHALAVADRQVSEDPSAIGAGFLDVFVAKLLKPVNGASRVGTAKAPALDWWATPNGIFAMAEEEHVEIAMRCIPGEEQMGAIIRDDLRTLARLCVKKGEGPWFDHRNATLERLVRELEQEAEASGTS